jgi:hypothetical protein
VLFASVERYGAPPFETSHFGGVPLSYFVKRDSQEERALLALNKQLLESFRLERGVTHAEFIRPAGFQREEKIGSTNISSSETSENGQFYFLEVAARVGGAYTADTIEAVTGINLWREWAKIELATPDRPYDLPSARREYGGIAVSLARQERPCTCRYDDPEVVYRVQKPWHVGLIVRSPDYGRVKNLLADYARRFKEDFTAIVPAEESPEQHI